MSATPPVFANAPAQYSQRSEQQFRDDVARELARRHTTLQDVEIGRDVRAIFTDTATGTRYALTVASGALTLTAL